MKSFVFVFVLVILTGLASARPSRSLSGQRCAEGEITVKDDSNRKWDCQAFPTMVCETALVEEFVPGGLEWTLTATCSAGETLTGGGCSINSLQAVVGVTKPNGENGWECSATARNQPDPMLAAAYAICCSIK